MMPTPHLPLGYAATISTFLASLLVELAVDLYQAGADGSTSAIAVLSWGSHLMCSLPLALNLICYLADRLAAPGNYVLDLAKDMAGTSIVHAWVGLGLTATTLTSWSGSIWYSVMCFFFHLVIVFWVFWPSLHVSTAEVSE